MKFEYNVIETATAHVDIDNVGDVYMRVMTATGAEFYLGICTVLGYSKVYTFGPIYQDFDKPILNAFGVSYNEIEFKESSLRRTIDKFLNNLVISKLDLISKDEFKSAYRNPLELI